MGLVAIEAFSPLIVALTPQTPLWKVIKSSEMLDAPVIPENDGAGLPGQPDRGYSRNKRRDRIAAEAKRYFLVDSAS